MNVTSKCPQNVASQGPRNVITTGSRLIAAILSLCLGIGVITAATDYHPDSVQMRMARQLYEYPQEKIHVTTDQGRYVAGDTVWLRAWVVDAATHEQVTASKFVYLELANPFGEVTNRIKLRQQDGIFAGYIPLDEEMAEGDYTLTAYTTFMQGPGQDYFFRKPMKVTSPYASQAKIHTEYELDGADLRVIASFLSSSGMPIHHEVGTLTTRDGKEYKSNPGKKEVSYRLSPERRKGGVAMLRFDNYRKFITLPTDTEEDIDVQFFPEGGYLIPDAVCMVGIKAIDQSGRGVDVSGIIKDTKGNKVAEFTTLHRGMGMVSFKPQAGESYTATLTSTGKTYPVGTPDSEAATLHVDNMKPGYSTVVATGKLPQNSSIVVLNRGRVQYAGYIESNTRMQFPRENLGEGVIQYLLIDGKGNRLSERLAFGNYADSTTFRAGAERKEGLMTLTLTLPEGMEGDVAVSVLDCSRMAQADTTTGIEAQLLLQSDLRGYVEDPGYYFRHKDRRGRLALDALLLTQGWSRYDVPQAINGRYSEPASAIEIGTEFSGKVKSLWKGKPLANARVTAIAPKIGFFGEAISDKDGNFYMTGPDFPENTKFLFQAFNKKGKNEMNFDIDADVTPTVKTIAPPQLILKEVEEYVDADEGTWVLSHNGGQMSVTLSDVTITRKKIEQKEDIYEMLAYKSSNYEDWEKQSITSYDEVLLRIPGIKFERGDIYYRNKPVEYVVDGIVWRNVDEETLGDVPDVGTKLRGDSKVDKDMGARALGETNTKPNMAVRVSFANAWQKESKFEAFRAMYPFDVMRRIDFLQPGVAILVSSNPSGKGGALVFTTKNGSEIKWEQPPHLKLASPLGYQKPLERYNPKYIANSTPNFGSTVYWNPNISLNEKSELEIAIPSNSTKLDILVEGINAFGETISQFMTK